MRRRGRVSKEKCQGDLYSQRYVFLAGASFLAISVWTLGTDAYGNGSYKQARVARLSLLSYKVLVDFRSELLDRARTPIVA